MTQPPPDEVYRGVTKAFGAIIAIFGLVIIIVTLAHGGNAGAGGVWIGLIFLGLGLGRLYLALRAERR
jgi:uncharacterized membrane protein